MSKSPLHHKTALVLGADNPVGRAIALRLTRDGCHVVLCGYEGKKLQQLEEFITSKKGNPAVAILPRSLDDVVAALRSSRDNMGHFHFVVNALATAEHGASHEMGALNTARAITEKVSELVAGRGTVRFATVWPAREDNAPSVNNNWFHVLLRYEGIAPSGTEDPASADSALSPESVRPGAVADTLSALLSCPGGACPIDVRLAPREVKLKPVYGENDKQEPNDAIE